MTRDHLASRATVTGRSPSANGLSRRRFLQAGAAAGGGLLLSLSLPFANGDGQAADEVVMGFDDKHLDFRVVVDVATSGGSRNVTATTLVKTHNLLGRTYLAVIMPFHRPVVRAMLRQVAG